VIHAGLLGTADNGFAVRINGHANPGNVSTDGKNGDYIVVYITQIPPDAFPATTTEGQIP
jgi:hypothetical protein